MDFIQILAGAIVFGSTLGTTVASLFAYRQKSLVTMLRESNKDYKDRVDQLEKDREADRKIMDAQTEQIQQLKHEKTLPLEKLTELIIAQHAQSQKSMIDLTKALNNQAKNL